MEIGAAARMLHRFPQEQWHELMVTRFARMIQVTIGILGASAHNNS
jgi:hypothetical protein